MVRCVRLLLSMLAVVAFSGGDTEAAPTADFGFAVSAGGGDFDVGSGVAVDGQSNVYTTGGFSGTADFDPGPDTFNLTSAGPQDVFVAKYNVAGALVWARQLGGSSSEVGTEVAVDGQGNAYTTGRFFGTADFDPGADTFNLTSAGLGDVFVSKLDGGGNFVWAKQMGGSSGDSGSGVAVDGQGNVYTTGNFRRTADFDPGSGTVNLTSTGGPDIFVSKLDNNGNFVRARTMGGRDTDAGFDVAVDGQGNVYTTGFFEGTADFDPGAGAVNLVSAGRPDVFVSKLDKNGKFVWARQLSGRGDDVGTSVAVDEQGNVYTTGYFFATADFDPGPGAVNLTSGGPGDVFVSKLDNNGKFVWAKRMGASGRDEGRSVAVDGQGNVYTTGLFTGTVDFDPGAGTVNLTSAGLQDMFVSKLTQRTIGDRVWHDLDGDGIQDAGEPGIAGAVVELFRWTGATPADGQSVSLGVQTTDANGAYRFVGPPESFRFYGLSSGHWCSSPTPCGTPAATTLSTATPTRSPAARLYSSCPRGTP